MIAKKMFEKLGYELCVDSVGIKYIKTAIESNGKKFLYKVTFYFESETYAAFILNPKEHISDVLYVDGSLNKAIQKQLVELGWLE